LTFKVRNELAKPAYGILTRKAVSPAAVIRNVPLAFPRSTQPFAIMFKTVR